jgi:hypothetical protein
MQLDQIAHELVAGIQARQGKAARRSTFRTCAESSEVC